ncbi:DNA-binding protein [Frankia sp. Cpl3]|nr:DNA-binding protein [Frankia sp. Cpl3]
MTTPTQQRNPTSNKATQSPPPTRHGRRELLPLTVVLAELGDEHGPLARSTFDDWRARGVAPKVIKLPNGQLRVDRADLNAWIDSRVQSPAA